MQAEKEHPGTALWRNPRVVTPGLLALGVIIFVSPLILARDAAWATIWVDTSLPLIAFATTLKCFATSRRLRGSQRTAWRFISAAYLAYALAESFWFFYEVILKTANPIPSPADFGYMIAPILLAIGIWIYRTDNPTFPEAIVQLGNTGILVAAILLANLIVFQQLVTTSLTQGQLRVLFTYSVITPTAAIFALFNIFFYMRGRRRTIMTPLLIALGTLAVADYTTAYEFVSGGYSVTSYANIGYFITLSFGTWAAFEQDYLGQTPEGDRDPRLFDDVARKWETLLPPVALAGLLAVAVAHHEQLTTDFIPRTSGALLLLIASVALRNWWSQRIESQLREQTRSDAASLQKSEERLLATNEELATSNRSLSKEATARSQIQEELRHSQKMEAIGQLTGGIAHDFNNLLAVIVGNIDMLEQTLKLDSSQLTYTQEATAAANRGAALTERLLAFSRKQALAPRPTRVADLVESMKNLLERTLGENIRLQFEMNAGLAPCMVDRAQLENAILNLVLNARDAIRGSGLITIETSNATLDARDVVENPDATEGDYVSIAVRDSGSGMPASVQKRVFEPFFTTKDMGAGSGLGLSMVYGFARQSGGYISIESELGSGTEVRIYIPQTDLPPEPIENININSSPSGQRESVLVVEDDPSLRQVIVSFLENRNYQVTAAPNGSEALAIMDEHESFDLLLSDVILPGEFSGPELAAEINSRQPSMKVLLMSGYASDALEGTASQPKYANLLQKPFNMGTLAREIRSVLEAKD